MKPKILIITSVASMIDQFNMPLIRYLVKNGYDVHVGCNFLKGGTITQEQTTLLKRRLIDLGVLIHQVDFERNVFKIIDNIKAYSQINMLCDKYKYSVIHCQSPIGGLIGRLVGKSFKTKVIYTAHGFHFFKGSPLINWIIYYPIEKFLSRYTDVLITINKEDYARAKKKFKARRIEYIPGVGVDINKFSDILINRDVIRMNLNIPENAFVVLSVGELNKNKNHEVIIRSLAKINNPSIYYLVCGQGPLQDYLNRLSIELGISNQVRLLGFQPNIKEFYKIADLFAFPSYREGLPVSLIEAIASGLPVIASNIRGNNELVVDGEGGYLFNPKKIDSITLLIQKILKNDSLKEFAELSQKNINKYDINSVLMTLSQIYENLIFG